MDEVQYIIDHSDAKLMVGEGAGRSGQMPHDQRQMPEAEEDDLG